MSGVIAWWTKNPIAANLVVQAAMAAQDQNLTDWLMNRVRRWRGVSLSRRPANGFSSLRRSTRTGVPASVRAPAASSGDRRV